MKKKKHQVFFLIIILLNLVLYYIIYKYSINYLIWVNIFLSVVLNIINISYVKIDDYSTKDTFQVVNFHIYNLDKLIIGFFSAVYLFVLDSGVVLDILHISSYVALVLNFITCVRIRKGISPTSESNE